jgi:predicted ATPase
MLSQFQGDSQAVQDAATQAAAICDAWGFVYYVAWADILQGWALAQEGYAVAGIAQMEQSLADLRATGAGLRELYYLTLPAEVHMQCGNLEQSQTSIDAALGILEARDERWCAAGLYQLQGTLLQRQGADDACAASWFRRAEEAVQCAAEA